MMDQEDITNIELAYTRFASSMWRRGSNNAITMCFPVPKRRPVRWRAQAPKMPCILERKKINEQLVSKGKHSLYECDETGYIAGD